MVPKKKNVQGVFLDAIHVLHAKQYQSLKKNNKFCKYSASQVCCIRLGSTKCMSVFCGEKRLHGLTGLQLTGGKATLLGQTCSDGVKLATKGNDRKARNKNHLFSRESRCQE